MCRCSGRCCTSGCAHSSRHPEPASHPIGPRRPNRTTASTRPGTDEPLASRKLDRRLDRRACRLGELLDLRAEDAPLADRAERMRVLAELATIHAALDNRPAAAPLIQRLVSEADQQVLEEIRDDTLTLFREAVRHGRAAEARDLLDASDAGERWRPLREALATAVHRVRRQAILA